ncbi:MAG TPA: tetratricopeptide repeat protein [Alphaproteobacteria bacterium]|jgi:Tfp pilus assembly protein PilF|nr:tetratricopeptide repeat protein [Alphaproteobacteria bacterium]
MAARPILAAPFIPTDDNQVLQRVLPSADPRLQAIREKAATLAQHPGDPDLSLDLAARQLGIGVAEADPRFVGYAQGTLAPWWREPEPPVPLRVLRARILQAQHDFPAAKRDLQAVLAADPNHVDAHLVLAGVSETTGDLATARTACDDLARIRPTLAATACAASVDSVSGHAERASDALELATARASARDPSLQCWALTILAEIAERRGDPAADGHFRDALAASPADVYTLTAYADYLLDRRRPADVTKLLAGKNRIDALLLRLALAARDSGAPEAGPYAEELAARYAAARARGEQLHLRDESRFELELRHEPQRALELARQNWAMQRTPLDARIYLEAALAANDAASARIVADWATGTGLEDHTLRDLLAKAPA